MKIKSLLCSIAVVTAVFGGSSAHADVLNKDVFVSDPWVQAMPPSQKITAAYMVIRNNSQKEIILRSVSSEIAGAAEIHQMSDMNGMMNMSMIVGIHIPALSKVTLKPGAYHIMLINLKKPVNKGDIVPIKLHFQDGSSIMVKANVRIQ